MSRIRLDMAQPIPPTLLADGFVGAILLSLFTDARGQAGDTYSGDPRGWWHDELSVDHDSTGSRLWLGGRDKNMPVVLSDYEMWATEALAWMKRDGVAQSIVVVASAPRRNVLWLDVQVDGRSIDMEISR